MPQPLSRTSTRNWLEAYSTSISMLLRLRMLECVDQSLPADAIDLIAQHRMQWPRLAVHNHAKSGVFLDGEFLLDARKRLFEIERTAMRRAQPANRVAAFLDHLLDQLQHAAQRWLGRRIGGQAVHRDMQLHGGAEEALQQRVVQFLRDAGPLEPAALQSAR